MRREIIEFQLNHRIRRHLLLQSTDTLNFCVLQCSSASLQRQRTPWRCKRSGPCRGRNILWWSTPCIGWCWHDQVVLKCWFRSKPHSCPAKKKVMITLFTITLCLTFSDKLLFTSLMTYCLWLILDMTSQAWPNEPEPKSLIFSNLSNVSKREKWFFALKTVDYFSLTWRPEVGRGVHQRPARHWNYPRPWWKDFVLGKARIYWRKFKKLWPFNCLCSALPNDWCSLARVLPKSLSIKKAEASQDVSSETSSTKSNRNEPWWFKSLINVDS